MATFEHILVATDFGEPSQSALELAERLAAESGCRLTLVHTFEIPHYSYTETIFVNVDIVTPLQQSARERLDELVAKTRKTVPNAEVRLYVGTPWKKVIEAIGDVGADLVVIGTHGRKGISHALLGSVAEKIVRASPVPVLTVHARSASAAV
jgi:nucleotide-binding universal stress UspA family protein